MRQKVKERKDKKIKIKRRYVALLFFRQRQIYYNHPPPLLQLLANHRISYMTKDKFKHKYTIFIHWKWIFSSIINKMLWLQFSFYQQQMNEIYM